MKSLDKKYLKKAALYSRVSTLEQSKGEFSSLDAQEEQLRGYCKAKNWSIHNVYIDDGKTAANIDRPALQNLISDAKANKFQILLSTKLDRISRNIHDWYNLIKILDSNNVQIAVLDINLDTSTAVGRMVRDILIAFAQFERELIAERTAEKMAATAKRGMWIGGTPPRGYNLEKGKLVPNKDSIKIIQRIFEDYKKGLKPSQIVKNLKSKGIKTPIYITKSGNQLGNKDYDVNIISKIISNPVYAGKILYNGNLYEGNHEGMISYKLWNDCQKISSPSNSTRLGTSKLLLLSGLIDCGYCGAKMTTGYTTKNGKRHLYYQCTTVQKNGRASCNQRNIKADSIESLVIKMCTELACDEKYVKASLSKIEKNRNDELLNTKKQIKVLNGKISNLKNQQNNLIAIIKNGTPNKATEALSKELDSVEIERFNLKDQVNKLELIKKGLQQNIIDPKVISRYFKQFKDRFNELEFEAKHNIINILIQDINIKIHHKDKSGTIKIKPRNMKGFNFDEKILLSSSLEKQVLRRRDSNPRPGG